MLDLKIPDQIKLLTSIDPVSQGAGTLDSAWISIGNFQLFLAVVSWGALGASATLDAKLRQAQDSGGTGAKDLGVAITQITAAGNNSKQAMLRFAPENFDPAGTFTFVSLRLTVGVAASLVAGQIWGANPRNASQVGVHAASVVQVI